MLGVVDEWADGGFGVSVGLDWASVEKLAALATELTGRTEVEGALMVIGDEDDGLAGSMAESKSILALAHSVLWKSDWNRVLTTSIG